MDLPRQVLEEMRDGLATLDGASAAFDDAIERGYAGPDETLVAHMIRHLVRNNLQAIYSNSGSPIETLFWASLALGFVVVNPFGAVFHRPITDAPKMLVSKRAEAKHVAAAAKEFRKTSDGLKVKEWLRARTDNEELVTWLSSAILAHDIGMNDAWHFTLQAGFPEILPTGRAIRVDLLAWRPNGGQAVVVECDGFEFHSGQDRFIADRQRDRALLAKGYRVLRYSGSEIHRDPVETAMNLYSFLMALDGKGPRK